MRTLYSRIRYRKQWRPLNPDINLFVLNSPSDSGTVRTRLSHVAGHRDGTLKLRFRQGPAAIVVTLEVTATGTRIIEGPREPVTSVKRSFHMDEDTTSFLDDFTDWYLDPARRDSLLQLISRQYSPARSLRANGNVPAQLRTDHLARSSRVYLLANIATGTIPAKQASLALAMIESGYDGTLEDLLAVTATTAAGR